MSNKNNFESGLNATIGFDYKIDNNNGNDFDFSVAQIINEKEKKKCQIQVVLMKNCQI